MTSCEGYIISLCCHISGLIYSHNGRSLRKPQMEIHSSPKY